MVYQKEKVKVKGDRQVRGVGPRQRAADASGIGDLDAPKYLAFLKLPSIKLSDSLYSWRCVFLAPANLSCDHVSDIHYSLSVDSHSAPSCM